MAINRLSEWNAPFLNPYSFLCTIMNRSFHCPGDKGGYNVLWGVAFGVSMVCVIQACRSRWALKVESIFCAETFRGGKCWCVLGKKPLPGLWAKMSREVPFHFQYHPGPATAPSLTWPISSPRAGTSCPSSPEITLPLAAADRCVPPSNPDAHLWPCSASASASFKFLGFPGGSVVKNLPASAWDGG